MSDDKAARLAAIRAANAAKPAASAGAPPTPISAAPPAAPPAAPAASPRAGVAAGGLLDLDHLPPAMPLANLVLLLLGAALGALAATFALPIWLPGLADSLLGVEPKAYWYLARSSAVVAYGLTWLSMLFGLLITSKAARLWPGGPVAFDLHQHSSLLGLAFGLFHALILLGDRYIAATPAQILVPFAYSAYRPLWVGLGQIALYLMAIVGLSFYIKGVLGRRAWRLIHFLSFALFALALAHGIFSGSDSAAPWARALYWATGGSVLFLALYRAILAAAPARKARAEAVR
jgi:predicted ferric reductase